MRWFKHLTNSAQDEKLCRVTDKIGLEGYGFYWRILEIISAQLDEKNKTFVEYSAKIWGKFLQVSPKRFQKFLEIFRENELFFIEINDNLIRVDCPNLLKYKDEYSSRREKNRDKLPTVSGQTPEEIQIQIQNIDTDTDIKESNKEKIIWFDEFWSVYPRKVGKAYALKVWKNKITNRALVDKIVEVIRNQRRLKMLNPEKAYKFCPYPSTWLNQERWNDKYCELLKCVNCGTKLTVYDGEDNKCPACGGTLK